MNKIKNIKGITLISLVVTIIILLILAGVSIAILMGDNGLINRAKDTKIATEIAEIKEEIEMAIMDIQIEEIEKGNNVTLETLENKQLANKLDNITAQLRNNEIIGEYKGYEYIINKKLEVTVKEKIEGENIDDYIQADKKIYISSEYGNDTIGEGSKEKPYKTLDKVSEAGIIENKYSYVIILMDGTYEMTKKMCDLDCNKEIHIIGDKEKTVLLVNTLYPNYTGGKDNYTISFYRLIWRATQCEDHNAIHPSIGINFYNVVFDIQYDSASYSYINPAINPFRLYNCVLNRKVANFFRDDTNVGLQLTNCYGGFTSGYGTNDNVWNYQTNYITYTPQLDEKYRITDDENVWKNKGTGTNLDGSQANLGVYGGEYSWEK